VGLIIYAVPLPGGGAGSGTPGGSTGGGNTGGNTGGGTTPNPGQSYRHVEPVLKNPWRFTHDLPFDPAAVRIVDADRPDTDWDPGVVYDPRTKTFTVSFPFPVRGEAFVS
jgi:hypothetical protein